MEARAMSAIPKGRFCWYELMTSDVEAALRFYPAVAGWTLQAWDGGGMPYTMWMRGSDPVGGVTILPKEAVLAGAPPHWLAYVSTPSLEDTLARSGELGGHLVWGPLDVPEVGRVAGLSDPQGAHFALYQPAGPAPGHEGPPSPGEFSWHELATTDMEGGFAYYTDLFDWQKAQDVPLSDVGIYRTFSRGAHPLGAMFNKPHHIPVCHWLLYVQVPDLDAALSSVRALGGTVLNGPEEVPAGDRVAQCLDPQNAPFALHERRSD